MKITILACGKMKDRALLDMYKEYMKRLPWSVELKEIIIKSKQQVGEQEKRRLLELIPDDAKVIMLDERGESYSSAGFAEKIEQWGQRDALQIVFVIGGADGLHPEVLKRGHKKISFGKMTWPHLLVRVLLAEQLYRAYTILKGHPYHRD